MGNHGDLFEKRGWKQDEFLVGMNQPLLRYNSKNRHNMKRKIADLHTCLNLIGAIMLLVGLGSAILIYRTAENDSNSILGYEEGDGSVYPVRPEDSKKYLRDLELYGGKANVLTDEFRRWFIGYGMENHSHSQ